MIKTESNPYPPPNNSKVLIKAVAMASACEGFTGGHVHQEDLSHLTQDLENECLLIANCLIFD